MADVQHLDVTSIHRFAYVSASDPGAVGAFKGWVDTSVSPYRFRIRDAGNTTWNDIGNDTSTMVALAGAQTITGVKTFSGGLITDTIISIHPGGSNVPADNLIVKPGASVGNAVGAAATFGGANATGTVSHVGGAATLIGGNGAPTGGGKGGNAVVQGGNGISSTSAGGDVVLSPGSGVGSGVGSIIIQPIGTVPKAIINVALLVATDRTYQFPDKSGTFAMTSDTGIGGAMPSGTVGSIPFIAAGPVWAQDNSHFKYSSSQGRLLLFDSSYAPVSTSSSLTIGGTSVDTSNDVIPLLININRLNSVSSPLNNIGISVTMNRSGILDTSASTVVGGSFIASTNGDSSTASIISGVIGKALPYVTTSTIVSGGTFSSEVVATGSGGSGNLSYISGVYSLVQGNQGRTVSVASAYVAQIKAQSTGIITAARGLDLTGWFKGGSATIGTSYGIYADTTIDVGTTKYFIYSTSVSQSYIQGSLGIGVALPAAKFNVVSTTEQARIAYDASNYVNFTVSSAGITTIDGAGASKAVKFASGLNLGFFGATAIAQPTTAITGATFVANSGTAVNDASTFDGYTMKQVVAALRALGALA